MALFVVVLLFSYSCIHARSLSLYVNVAITIQFTSSVFAADYDPTIGKLSQVLLSWPDTLCNCNHVSWNADFVLSGTTCYF